MFVRIYLKFSIKTDKDNCLIENTKIFKTEEFEIKDAFLYVNVTGKISIETIHAFNSRKRPRFVKEAIKSRVIIFSINNKNLHPRKL